MIPLESLFAFHVGGQTEFQLDYRVTTRAGGTPYGCLVQAVRELWKRFRGVREDWHQRELCQIDIEELESKLVDEVYAATFDGRRDAASLKQKRLHLAEIEKHTENDEREFIRFYGQAAALWCHLGFDVSPPSRDKIEELEAERREHDTRCQLALDIMGGGIRPGTVSAIQCLPGEIRQRLLAAGGIVADGAQSGNLRAQTVNWFLNYSPEIPGALAIDLAEARRLLACSESLPLLALSPNSSPMASGQSPLSSTPNASESVRSARNAPALAAGCAAAS